MSSHQPSTTATGSPTARPGQVLPPLTLAGLVVAALAILLIALFTYLMARTREENVRRITQTMQTLQQLETLLSSIQDAETGQRGFS